MICTETHFILSYLTATFLDFFYFQSKAQVQGGFNNQTGKKNTLHKGRKWH